MAKTKKIAIPVSRTNFNRFKYWTHTLERVLKMEGHRVINGMVQNPINGEEVRLCNIELYQRRPAITAN